MSARSHVSHEVNLRKRMQELWPPNPKEFDNATLISYFCFSEPTKMLKSTSSSGSSRFRFGCKKPARHCMSSEQHHCAPLADARMHHSSHNRYFKKGQQRHRVSMHNMVHPAQGSQVHATKIGMPTAELTGVEGHGLDYVVTLSECKLCLLPT